MIPEKVGKVLKQHELEAVEFETGSTATSQTAAEKFGVAVGQIAKSILLVGKKGGYYMVVCAGDKRISSSRLKKIVGEKTRMASAAETERITGFSPGGVCPFGVTDVDIFVDKSLAQYSVVYPAAGTDSSGVPITFEQLKAVTMGALCDVTM